MLMSQRYEPLSLRQLSASEASTVDREIERQGQVFGLRNQRNQKDHTATLARSRVIRGKKRKVFWRV